MKKFLLLLTIGAMAGVANGQEASRSILNNDQVSAKTSHFSGRSIDQFNFSQADPAAAARTSVAYGPQDRWYDYVDSNFAIFGQGEGCHPVSSIAGTLVALWNDTTAEFGYMGSSGAAWYNDNWTSVGLGFAPWQNWWNTPYFSGEMAVRRSDSYVIDSVRAIGIYGRNTATVPKQNVVDSIRFDLVWGNGTQTSGDLPFYYFTGMTNYCVDTLNFLALFHDSLNNHATNQPSSTSNSSKYYAFPLHNTDMDTVNFHKAFPLSPAFAVGPSVVVAASVSFKSGDPTYPASGAVPRDTVQRADGTYKYNSFQSLVVYNGDVTSGTVSYANYDPANDLVSGYFKREGGYDGGWGGQYIPNWAWSTSTGASGLQYPDIWFHVHCTTCPIVNTSLEVATPTVNSLKAYPNPADNQLNIEYSLMKSSNVIVTLTNMVGQVVSEQHLGNVTSGTATINTTDIAAGMYIMTLSSDGHRTTNHIAIAH